MKKTKLVSIVVAIDPSSINPLEMLAEMKEFLKNKYGISGDDVDMHTRTIRR